MKTIEGRAKRREQRGQSAPTKTGGGGGSGWDRLIGGVMQQSVRQPPLPPSFEMPSFEMPSFDFEFPKPPREPKSKTLAEKLQEEAGQFAGVKAGERVFSAAQGVSTRLRAAVRQEEDDNKGGLGTLGESAGTILGRRGRGGATSRRRTRLSRY